MSRLSYGDAIEIHPDATAVRPVRVVGEDFRYYSATTFPGADVVASIGLFVRRMAVGKGVWSGDGMPDDVYAVLDVIDADFNVLQDFGLSKDAFDYARRKLKFTVEGGDT